MSTNQQEETDKKYDALLRGLGSRSSTKISSACYITAKLNGLDERGEYEFVDGHGVLNEPILFDKLSSLERIIYREDSEEVSKEMEGVGEFLKGFDDLDLIALCLYSEEGGEIYGWHEAELEENSEAVKQDLEEIRERLEC